MEVMKVYFVTNDQAYSKFFLKLFKTSSSHIGFGFSIDGYDYVIDANKPYGKLCLLKQWLLKYKIVKYIDISLPIEVEKGLYSKCVDGIVGIPYDMGAYKYGVLCRMLYLLFNKPYPKVNKWSCPDKLCCTEIFNVVKTDFSDIGLDISDLLFDTLLPDTICSILVNRAQPLENITFYG